MLIDRLLASPRYGERYGRHWLDLVRYAETDGFKQTPIARTLAALRLRHRRSMTTSRMTACARLPGDEVAIDDASVLVATTYLRHGCTSTTSGCPC